MLFLESPGKLNTHPSQFLANLHKATSRTTTNNMQKSDLRQDVIRQFETAAFENKRAYQMAKHPRHLMATSEYIYKNQKDDAQEIVELFRDNEGGHRQSLPSREHQEAHQIGCGRSDFVVGQGDVLGR